LKELVATKGAEQYGVARFQPGSTETSTANYPEAENVVEQARTNINRMKDEVHGWVNGLRDMHESMRDEVRAQRRLVQKELVQSSEILKKVQQLEARMDVMEKELRAAESMVVRA
jgi:hypothetical protein